MVESRIPFRAVPRLNAPILRCQPLSAPAIPPPKGIWQWSRLIARRCAQSFRLMVGVQDYANYVEHQHRHHPDLPVMSERDFHRYCLEARFPSKGGKLGKCPC